MMSTRAEGRHPEVKCDPFVCNNMTLETYRCKLCNFESDLKVILTAHLRLVHEGKETNSDLDRILECYRCENCDFKTHSVVLLAQHTYKHCRSDGFNEIKSDLKPRLTEKLPKTQNSNDGLLLKKCKHCLHFRTSVRSNTNTEDVVWHRCEYCEFKTKCKGDLKKHFAILHQHRGLQYIHWLQCGHCEYKTNTKQDLKEHVLRRHPKPKNMLMLKCKHCSYETILGTVKPTEVSKCVQCSYKCTSKVDLMEHIFMEHNGQTQNIQGIVNYCPKMDVTVVKYMKSCESNIPKVYKCRPCKFETDFKVLISYHKRVEHERINFCKSWEVIKVYHCDYCDYCEFTTNSLLILTKHNCQQHPKMIVLKYEHCSYKTMQKMCLQAHMNQIHDKPDNSKDIVKLQDILQCTLCSYKTTSEVNLAGHILMEHKGQTQNIYRPQMYLNGHMNQIHVKPGNSKDVKPQDILQCTLSSNRSTSKINSVEHILTEHKQLTQNIQATGNYRPKMDVTFVKPVRFCKLDIPKVYKCRCCNFETEFKILISYHNRVVHERVKFCDIWELMNTYKCAHCEFTTNSLLVLMKHSCQQHSKMQLAIKCGNWFQCIQCDYKTECKETLSHHVRWKLCDEQKMKWFECNDCMYKSKWRGDFLRHLNNHSRGKL